MPFVLQCQPRFDYGRAEHTVDLTKDGAVFAAGRRCLTLHASGQIAREHNVHLARDADGGVTAAATLRAGEVGAVMLKFGPEPEPRRLSLDEVQGHLDDTIAFWRRWLARSTYRGRWREQVLRSAMTLKLMTYAPSGALVAAPTTSLPEQIGGERNWDYRYTWVRDASFSVYALLRLGYVDEARAFVDWLSDRVQEQAGAGSGPLKVMYRVDGSSDLTEQVLDNFEGYRGSRPARVGNGAADQLQLDIYGEAMEAIAFADRHDVGIGHETWTRLAAIADWLCDHWDQPDEGIWETRGGPQDFVYSRLNCWVALDRAGRLAWKWGRPGDVLRWTAERDRLYRQIMKRGWDPTSGAFVQHYGSQVLDASLLRMSHVGFVTPADPMWLSTLDALDTELVSDSLVYRYNPEASPDGLRGDEGTFSMCTFWYVEALARSGRLEKARRVFEKMLTYANHLGLYGEEIGRTGEQLGNFPQAFTHLALINAATVLDRELERDQ
jgi:GH15 family glucan-1,4-alpha-glucosidase